LAQWVAVWATWGRLSGSWPLRAGRSSALPRLAAAGLGLATLNLGFRLCRIQRCRIQQQQPGRRRQRLSQLISRKRELLPLAFAQPYGQAVRRWYIIPDQAAATYARAETI
jgi:hypothetical protein